MQSFCKDQDQVLVLYNESDDLENLKSTLLPFQDLQVKIVTETLQSLLNSTHATASFDVILYGFVCPAKKVDEEKILIEIVRLLKPNGKFVFRKSGSDDCVMQIFVMNLKFSGFVSIEETTEYIQAQKPGYEIGSKFDVVTKQMAEQASEEVEKIWGMLASSGPAELIDTDTLLTEEDLKKPDPESLRVCGSTGKRKACANCTCGLVEELDKEAKEKRDQNGPKSSCGSCYLGDAFRCANCPYLGMPAFKPGEKVVLENLSDI